MQPPYCSRGALGNPQNARKAIFGKKKLDIFKNARISGVKSTFSRVGGSVWELKIGPKRHREQNRRSQGRFRQQKKKQTRPNTISTRISRPNLVDLRAPETPPNTPKTTQNEPKRVPESTQTSLPIQNFDFSKCKDSYSKTIIFEGWRGSL